VHCSLNQNAGALANLGQESILNALSTGQEGSTESGIGKTQIVKTRIIKTQAARLVKG